MKNFIAQLSLMLGITITLVSIILFLAHLFVGELLIGLILTGIGGYILARVGYYCWMPDVTGVKYPKIKKPQSEVDIISEGLNKQFKRINK